jgi:hypothetical protein
MIVMMIMVLDDDDVVVDKDVKNGYRYQFYHF